MTNLSFEVPRSMNGGVVSWVKPPAGLFKVNVDVIIFQNQCNIGMGCIIRDEQGRFVSAFAKRMTGLFSPKEAESLLFREALSWLKHKRMDGLIIETDAQSVIHSIVSSKEDRTQFGFVIDDCKSLVSQFAQVHCQFIRRTANHAAHVLARTAGSMTVAMEWEIPPHFLLDVIYCNSV